VRERDLHLAIAARSPGLDHGSVPQRLEPGVVLDRYELLCPIAQGGMAEVWLARFAGKFGFEKLVAIKTILAAHAPDPKFQQMFLDEARIISRIRHPNVAEILDVGEHEGAVYHVLEWIEGAALSKLYRPFRQADVPFPPRMALRILAEACDGLHAAHEIRGTDGRPLEVVHRDVSPSNVLVSVSGGVKVIDFGVAKALNRMSETTTTGAVKGKLVYMSPEQALAKPVDRRSDVWSVGAVLYYLLSGRRPYEADNPVALISLLVAREPPAPLSEVPEPIAHVVERALAYDPEHRFPTAAALARALDSAAVSVYGVTTSADIASFVEEYAGPDLAAQRLRIETALDARRTDVRPWTPELATAPTDASSAAPAVTASASQAPVEPSESQISLKHMVGAHTLRPPDARRRVVIGAVLGGLAFVAAVALAIGARHALSTEDSPRSAAPAASAPPAVAPPPATLEPSIAPPASTRVATVAPPASIQSAAPKPVAKAKPAPAPQPRSKPNCDPNYYHDDKGIKRYKPECFQ
jgi:serine/threonine-protein kinase